MHFHINSTFRSKLDVESTKWDCEGLVMICFASFAVGEFKEEILVGEL
jgi:hypothetical protein